MSIFQETTRHLKFLQVLAGTLTNISESFSAYSSVLNIPNIFCFFPKKKVRFLSGQGFCPPPLSGNVRLNVRFFWEGSPSKKGKKEEKNFSHLIHLKIFISFLY